MAPKTSEDYASEIEEMGFLKNLILSFIMFFIIIMFFVFIKAVISFDSFKGLLTDMYDSLIYVSIASIVISFISFAYDTIKKKRKKP